MIVGFDSGILLRGSMTGVANYTFHVVQALLEQDTSLRLAGFNGLVWREISPASLQMIAAAHDKHSDLLRSGGARGQLARLTAMAATRLTRVRPARLLYRTMYHRRFAASVHSQNLDLFHAFNFRPPSDPGVPVLPVIYDLSTFRHPELHPAERVQWLARLGDIIARAPMVHTISEFSKREIISVFGTPAEKIFVAPPAAASLYQPLGYEATQRDLAPLDLDYGNFFLTVGTLEPRKNIRTLIAAYAQLPSAERARCPLVVVGGRGWGNLDLPAQAEALRVDGTLRFLGRATNPQLRSLYEGTKLMLIPSFYEGFGMPVVEALACGTAVAHSVDTAMDEISAGLARCVVAQDLDGWADVLREAIAQNSHGDEALRETRVRRARQFDWRRSAEIVISSYRQLVPGRA